MYITTKSIHKPTFKTNEATHRIPKKYITQYELAHTINKEKEFPKSERNSFKPFATIYEDNNEDFLLLFWKRFDDIFKKLDGHEKIFEQLKERNKNRRMSNKLLTNVYSRKINFPKKKVIKHQKIDVKKIIEIQKMFKGHFTRNVNLNIDRLKLRQCLVELFCLLLLGDWCHSQKRYYFYLLKKYYISSKLYTEDELTFNDRIKFKLSSCFYSKAKINDLKSKRFGEDLEFD